MCSTISSVMAGLADAMATKAKMSAAVCFVSFGRERPYTEHAAENSFSPF
jgi:hypothetical protein